MSRITSPVTVPAATALILLLLLAVQLPAQRQNPLLPERRHHGSTLELTAHTVDAEIIDQVAQVEICQTFTNYSNRTIEGTYYFPLPKEAAVSDFKMIADGKVMSGEILEKDEARKIYEDIVRRKLDPALLEYAEYNLFKARIFPIPPGKDREIILEYASLLPQDGGLVQFNYPMGGQISCNRDRNNNHKAGRAEPVITIKLKSKTALKSIYSPSHSIDIARRNSHLADISYEGSSRGSQQNFVLYYSSSAGEFGVNLITHDPDNGEDGYFMMLVTPGNTFNHKDIVRKDIVFILDKSGSMEGQKIAQAKEALKYCLNNLDDEDRFNLITFSTDIRRYRSQMVEAAEGRRGALKFVDGIEAGGGTNINDALQEALAINFRGDRPISIVFLTDGLPTAGVRDAAEIIRNVTSGNKIDAKIFTFGVGYDVNTFLLDKIAAVSNAVSDYIEPEENIEERITAFFNKIRYPVLTDLTINYGRMRVTDVYPQQLPDLYKGEQLTIIGRYRINGKARITIDGKTNGKKKRISHLTDLPQEEVNHDFIPHLWASRKIGFLTDEIRLRGESNEMKNEIIKLSKKFGIMSIYTSYLVLEDEELADTDRIIPPPIFRPAAQKTRGATRGFNLVSAAGVQEEAKMGYSSGAGAVKISKDTRTLKEAESVQSHAAVKHIGSHTFILRDGLWTDSEYNEEKLIEIKYGSKAYELFALKYIDQAKYLALGDHFLFKFKGKFIKISDTGLEQITDEELDQLLK